MPGARSANASRDSEFPLKQQTQPALAHLSPHAEKILLKTSCLMTTYVGSMTNIKMKPPVISDSEWKIMRLLWRKSPQGAYDIIEQLGPREGWHPNTIKTMLARLHKKNVVTVSKYKNLYLYAPLISEEECIQVESQSFLDRLFEGSVKPLLVHFAKNKKFSKSDLDELRKILEGKEKK